MEDLTDRWLAREYTNLRNELNSRIDALHKTINLAIIFWAIFIIAGFVFLVLQIDEGYFLTYLLLVPIVIDLIAFNYQSNQNSLESIPKYYHEYIKPLITKKCGSEVLCWEKYFAEQKEPFRYESVTKVFPFIFPSLIPIYLLVVKEPLTYYQVILAVIDILFLLLMLENFRYKLRRVK